MPDMQEIYRAGLEYLTETERQVLPLQDWVAIVATRQQLKLEAEESEDNRRFDRMIGLMCGQEKHEFVIMDTMPNCDFGCGKQAVIDGATNIRGRWGYMCEAHRSEHYAHGDAVGLGMGQLLIPRE